jgi:WD40 repeat protein
VGLSADGKTLALGGLLRVLRGQDQVFFFDVTHPREPQFIRSDDPPHASIADEFDSLSDGSFFGTFMGSPDGENPGRLVECDANQHYVQAWPLNPPADGSDPHGLAIDETHNLILTSDFICPQHTLNVTGGDEVILRGSVRVWDFEKRTIVSKIVVGDPANPAGTIGRWPNSRRCAASRIYRRNGGQQALPAGHEKGHGNAGLRFLQLHGLQLPDLAAAFPD